MKCTSKVDGQGRLLCGGSDVCDMSAEQLQRRPLGRSAPKQVGHIDNGHDFGGFFKGQRDDHGGLGKVGWEWKEMMLEKKKHLGQWNVVGPVRDLNLFL